MRCPYCGSSETKVIDKRDNLHDSTTRRRRECMSCTKRFTTYERIENIDLNVIKKDGSVESFNREKLAKGIFKALRKDEISDTTINEIIEEIEMDLLSRKSTVIRSTDIGKLVLKKLKGISPVAYMRFASVYKEFSSLQDFKEELKELEKTG